jgi:ABC-type cobalamin/Fe3+-siderophores transport system ATPase subunit
MPREVFTQERLASVFGIQVAVTEIAGTPVVVPLAVTAR